MKKSNLNKTIALLILAIYFSVKLIGTVVNVSTKTVTVNVKSNQKFLYLLGSGHGYYGGSCGNKAVLESDGRCFYEWIFNWEVRRHLSEMLDSAKIEYKFINTSLKADLPIKQRAKKANNIKSNKPKVYISIHANASNTKKKGWEKVHGFEVYSPEDKYIIKDAYSNKKSFSDTIATIMAEELQLMFPEHTHRAPHDKKHKEASFTVISKSKCYSILTENEFFTNPEMRGKMRTTVFIRKVARAHFNLIMKLESK